MLVSVWIDSIAVVSKYFTNLLIRARPSQVYTDLFVSENVADAK